MALNVGHLLSVRNSHILRLLATESAASLCSGLQKGNRSKTTYQYTFKTKEEIKRERKEKAEEITELINRVDTELDIKQIPYEKRRYFMSGDNEPFHSLTQEERSLPIPKLQDSEELESAPDLVKKAYSLQYANHVEVVQYRSEQMRLKFAQHAMDRDSLEAQIAGLTIRIRNLQRHHMEKRFRYEFQSKAITVRLIRKRACLLEALREINIEAYEALIKGLNVTPSEPETEKKLVRDRRTLMTKYAIDKAQELRRRKLEELRSELEKRKEEFFAEKQRILAELEREERELGIKEEDKKRVLEPEDDHTFLEIGYPPIKDGLKPWPLKVKVPS